MITTKVFLVSLTLILGVYGKRSRKLEDVACKPSDFYYDFTECDAERGRWRVAIPSTPACEGVIPPTPPKRLDECYKSCEAGEFLDLESVECKSCEPGSYSLGGGLRFDEWDPLPLGFRVQVEKFRSVFSTFGRQFGELNCSKWGWRPKGDVILSQGGPCVATLLYSADLVKPGSLKFTYQYSDDSLLFQFQANSAQCESLREAEGSRWPPLTGEGIWRTEEIELRTGHNIFQWKTMGIDSHRPKPVLIKKIEIDGVGYTSSCLACSGGTWNDQSAAKECKPCPKDTYSHRNSTSCIPCNSDEYSEPGSSSCKKRPKCTASDFYQVNTPCNSQNQTRIIYKWVEPKICVGGSDAQELPPPGEYTPCPPCNPGTEYRNGRCISCSGSTFSDDGLTPCRECPSNTAPDTSHHLTQWFAWPDNLQSTCISPEDTGCSQSPAWQLNGDYVRSGKGHSEWVYLVMTLTVGGFRGVGGIINGQLIEVGRLIFSFEMICQRNCELLLMQGTTTKNATVIQRWTGTQGRQEYTHSILKNDSYSFSWAFQKVAWDAASSEGSLREDWNDPSGQWPPMDDPSVVKIYEIRVSNTIDGGATSCVQCQEGFIYSKNMENTKQKGSCITCQPGNYRTTIKHVGNGSSVIGKEGVPIVKCSPCPKNSVTVGPFATNCTLCGPALISKDGLTCSTDCMIELGGYNYDLRPLKGFHSVRGTPLFTSSGTQYYHAYNISFCTEEKAQCYKNVSLPRGFEPQQNPKVEALICQSTIFPPVGGTGMDINLYGDTGLQPLSTHAGTLGDHLIGISHSPSLLGVSVANAIKDHLESPHQFHFFYSTSEPTAACPKGRSTTISFRCRMPTTSWSGVHSDTPGSEDADIKIPDGCPDVTCDGCNYHFIWETPFACHICKDDELTIVRGECKNGFQEVHYLSSPNSLCILKHNATWAKSLKCTNHLPFAIEVAIQLAIALSVLLTVLLFCFWRRHRKLEYKYMKLVASGNSHSDENSHQTGESHHSQANMLPVAESCALDPDDDLDDDEEENLYSKDSQKAQRLRASQLKEVSFYSDSTLKNLVSKFSVFNKIKSLNRKEDHNSLEIMNLTDKEELT